MCLEVEDVYFLMLLVYFVRVIYKYIVIIFMVLDIDFGFGIRIFLVNYLIVWDWWYLREDVDLYIRDI